jgi:hypothetical protein
MTFGVECGPSCVTSPGSIPPLLGSIYKHTQWIDIYNNNWIFSIHLIALFDIIVNKASNEISKSLFGSR